MTGEGISGSVISYSQARSSVPPKIPLMNLFSVNLKRCGLGIKYGLGITHGLENMDWV